MRLKRLEMVGFKSFADKTRVEFEPGVTAVIGPNGCGKSNISDSIRWALGEMSAKSLRSQQMMDVIFNGTANRPAQGMSEVALTFDNSSHQLPIDYTEVTVARRLFRSGESEYYINKTQCRLKDIRDLFLDTGVGNDGYYVMAQGKIEFILSAKPEDRRELFEEAAGVAKYKARREEAIRRLNKVEQDMLRLNDSLAIYKQQMDNLDAAVRKAKQHQKIQEELRTMEIATLLHSIVNTQTQWTTLHSQHEETANTLSQLKQALLERESQVTENRSKAESMEQDVLDLQRKVAQVESEWAKAETEKNAAIEREAEIKVLQVRFQEEVSQLQKNLTEGTAKQADLTQEVETLKAVFREKNDAYKAEDEKGQTELHEAQTLQRSLETTKSRLLELVRLISHHRNETVRLTSLSVRHEEAAKSKKRELEKVQQKRQTLEEQIRSQETTTAQSREQLAGLESRHGAIEEQQTRNTDKLQEVDSAIQSARERIARLEAEKVSLERWLSQDPVALASHFIRQQNLPGIHGPISSIFKTSEPYQRLLDRALGDRAHFFIADTLNDAQAAIRTLSDERQGWATFIVLDRLTQSEQHAASDTGETRSLADVVECDARFAPVLQYLIGRTFYVGATLFEESVLRGGADPIGESFQATPTDLIRLNQELSSLTETLNALNTTKGELKTLLADLQTQKSSFIKEHQEAKVAVQVQEENLQRIREDYKLTETEERVLQHEESESLQAITQAQATLEKEGALLATLESEHQGLQETTHSQDSALLELRQTIQVHQAHISQLRLDAETTRERYTGRERDLENTHREMESLTQRITQNQKDFSDNQERLTQLAALQTEKTGLLETLQVARDSQNSQLNDLLRQRQDVQERLHREERELAEQRDALSQAQTRAQEAEFQARTLEQEKTRLEQTLQDTYQLSVEEAQSHYAEVQPNGEELARLRRRMESLGAVNLAAPEEHAQLEERYHFLLTQQQDLLKAKDDLHQAISKINATTREHFKETFDQVRQNFKQLYQTLFRGGEADVILTDEHNLAETGIDIVAQPPGKKLQNIALLSGGEKALTAIALLFAFFMVKPSPFCLLDEVDAPLDEANVGRFIELVKSFAGKTQFIMITHNKRTMEMADIIYGVTMAELGVSSLISMKMESKKPTEVVAA